MVPLSSTDTAKHKTVAVYSCVLRKTFLVCLLALGFVPFLHAQTYYSASSAGVSPNNKPGSPVGSYAISDFESVNPYSGKLNFSLPLVSIGGRGSAGYAIHLKLQKSWSIRHDVYDPNTYLPGSETYFKEHTYIPLDYEHGSNIEIIRGPGLMKGRMAGTNRSIFVCGRQPCYDETLTRLSFERSDGTMIEFRDVLHGGRPLSSPGTVTSLTRGTHWVSTDGTNATFISSMAVMDNNLKGYGDLTFFPSGVLYLPDGTKYIIDGGSVLEIIDVNGNKVSSLSTIRDATGREIGFTENINPTTYQVYDKTISYKGTNGANRNIKIDYSALGERLANGDTLADMYELFPVQHEGPPPALGLYNPGVVESVELPDGRKYEFKYNRYGELAEVKLPTGGKIEYVWQIASGLYNLGGEPDGGTEYEVYRRVGFRRVYENNVLQNETVYGFPDYEDFSVTVSTYQNNSGTLGLVNRTKHYYADTPIPGWHPIRRPTEEPHWLSGKELRTEVYDAGGTLLRKTENVWEPGVSLAANPGTAINHRISQVTETLADANLVSKKTFGYDAFNNQTDVYEYDYGTGAPGAFLRRSHTDYVTDANYTSHTGSHLRSLPLQTWVSSDINGTTKASLTQFEYDNYATDSNHAALVARSNVVGHDAANYGTANVRRGNATAVTTYANAQAQTGAVAAYSQYDILGNVVKTIDANGNASTISYADNFGAPDGEATTNTPPSQLNGLSTFAFPTSTTNPMNWTGYAQYDYFTGLPVNAQDINGVISKTLYADPLDRPTQSAAAVGTTLETQSNITYDDANRRIETKSDLNALNDNLLKSESFYDGLGRIVESRKYEMGGYVATKSEYDPLGRVKRVTNPYRPLINETAYWTETFYDALGRVTRVRAPDNAEAVTSYAGNSATSTDEAGKKRRTVTDAVGRMVRVDEPDANGNLGTLASPVQPTNYSFDTLGNLTQIVQGGQTRSFAYSSLSRLLSATNPESGTFQYAYDNNGNLLTKTDARGISTAYTYDALNRVTFRNYSDSTPDITYTYDDPQVQFSKGKLTKVASSISETSYLGYDAQERITASRQRTDGVDYDFGYTYNLDDDLKTQTYPSGKVVAFAYDSGGDLASVSGTTGQTNRLYANSFGYAAHGVVEQVRLGNGRWETTRFNSDRQIVQIGLGHSTVNTGLWKVDYEYGELQTNGTIDAAKNNGNLARQSITVPTVGTAAGFTALQSYLYDPLDRLKSATETIGGNQTWNQTFKYDRFGNKNFDTGTTLLSSESNIPKIANPEILPSNNKFKEDQDADGQPDYLYDASGNIAKNARAQDFTYDAENRQVAATGSGLSTSYAYDGNGKRIKTHNAVTNQTTIFVYDAEGDLSAEYTINIPPPANPTISYLTEDALGSPRVITNSFGEIKARRDFLPFGEELYAGLAGRNANQKYSSSSDDTRKKFATYQRDAETGLDFAQSRYYSPVLGRFISPDEFKGGPNELFDFEKTASDNPTFYADLINPQSLNKYQYSYNNPYKYNDPSGHCPTCEKPKLAIGPLLPAAVGALLYILASPSETGPRQPQTTADIAGDILGLVPIPGSKYVGGVVGRLLLRGAKKTVTKTATTTVTTTVTKVAKPPKVPKNQRVGPVPKKVRKQKLDQNRKENNGNLKCDYCGDDMVPAKKSQKGVTPPKNEATLDHVNPRSRGGSNDPSNLKPSCRKCNLEKSDND